MSNSIPTLDLHTLETVNGGSHKAAQAELKTAMTQIKDSLSSLKKDATSSSGDMMPMMMMMMMRR